MSIINEALKKTGQFIQENEGKHNPAAKAVPTPKPFLVYILMLLVGILVSKFIFDLISRPHAPSQNLPIQKTEPPKSAVVAPEPAIAPTATLESSTTAAEQAFVLNGIFFSDNDGYALINNQIVRETDSVDGAIVTRITANTVELDRNGNFISLSTRR